MAKTSKLPSVEYLNECFTPDFELGILTWNVRPLSHFVDERSMKIWNTRFSKTQAGSITRSTGYFSVCIFKSNFLIHRIIWKINYNEEPTFIDHIDTNKLNNAISNLRAATGSNNQCNRTNQKNNTSGVKGVYWSNYCNRWIAQIWINRQHITRQFVNFEDAVTCRHQLAEQLHGEFVNHG